MRGIVNIPLKEECIRLRQEERLSLREIHDLTGAPKGSLSAWLKAYPLQEAERSRYRSKAPRYQTPKKERGTESVLHQQVSADKLTKHQRAKVAEAAVLLRLLLHGMIPFGSVFDGDKTDWLVEVPATGRVLKFQVKWAYCVAPGGFGLPVVGLTCTLGHGKRRRYKDGEFDFIVGYVYFTDTAYIWTWEEVKHLKSAVSVHEEAAEAWHKVPGGK